MLVGYNWFYTDYFLPSFFPSIHPLLLPSVPPSSRPCFQTSDTSGRGKNILLRHVLTWLSLQKFEKLATKPKPKYKPYFSIKTLLFSFWNCKKKKRNMCQCGQMLKRTPTLEPTCLLWFFFFSDIIFTSWYPAKLLLDGNGINNLILGWVYNQFTQPFPFVRFCAYSEDRDVCTTVINIFPFYCWCYSTIYMRPNVIFTHTKNFPFKSCNQHNILTFFQKPLK